MGAFWGPDVTGHDGAELPMSFAAHSRHLSASGDEPHPASGPLRSSRFLGNPRHAAYPPSSTPSSSHSQSLPLLSALLGSSNRASLFAFPDGPGSSEHRYGPPGTGSPFQFPPTSGDLHGHRPLHESHAPTMQDWQGSIHEGVERIVRQDSQTGEFYYEGSRHYMGENRGRHPSPVEMQYTHHAQELSRSASSPLLIPQLTSSLLASHDPSSNLHLINPFSESPSLSARQHPPHLDTSQSEPLPSTSTGSNGSSQLTIGSLLQSLPLSTSLAPSSPSGGSHPGNDPSSPVIRPFAFKLNKLLSNPDIYGDLIYWDSTGECFLLAHTNPKLQNEVLPALFGHSSIAAFQRQLNIYDFRHLPSQELDSLQPRPTVSTYSTLLAQEWSAFTHDTYKRYDPRLELLKPRPSRARAAKKAEKDRLHGGAFGGG